ncbi:MAG: glycosyltransferase family 39 protein [Nitrospirae bacterium]|nr:glycosyltransferase family 39 protein [Nitrospirota bacterium]
MNTQSRNAVILAVFFIFSLGLRLWGIEESNFFGSDELTVVPAVEYFFSDGNFMPDEWTHPPLKYYLLYAGMKVFGNNVYGWRLVNVILGSLTVVLLYLLGKELFPDLRVAAPAAFFLAVEPVHIVYSRTFYGEISSLFFFMLGVYITLRYLKGERSSPVGIGICLGLALAQKWYFLPLMVTLPAWVILTKYRDGGLKRLDVPHMVAIFLFLPVAVYLLVFCPWFKRGYSVMEFFGMQLDAYRAMQAQTMSWFGNDFFRASPSSPWDWFIKPILYGRVTGGDGFYGKFEIFMSNSPVWLLAVPAFLYAAYRVWKNRDGSLILIIVLFAATYTQFVIVKRAIFLYSALVVLPFVYLAVAHFLLAMSQKRTSYFFMLMTVIALWSLYIFPFATGRSVPLALYAPLISAGGIAVP